MFISCGLWLWVKVKMFSMNQSRVVDTGKIVSYAIEKSRHAEK